MPYRSAALLIGLLALGALLGGCHATNALIPPNLRPPTEDSGESLKLARQQLQQATPCCSNFADFSYQNMLPWHPRKFSIGSGSMVANLDGAQSYFLAFRLPENSRLPYRVALKSELTGRWLHSSYLFAPTVVVLDEGFQPIRSEDIDLCEHMGWSDETTGAFGSITISSDKARYLLVYSSAKQQAGSTYWEQSPASIPTTISPATLKMTSAGSFGIAHGPDGTLWVGMMNSTYAKALDNAICHKPAKGDGVLNALPIPWGRSTDRKGSQSP